MIALPPDTSDPASPKDPAMPADESSYPGPPGGVIDIAPGTEPSLIDRQNIHPKVGGNSE